MSQSVHGLKPARLNRVASTLQRMQDDPEVLDRSRIRFDADEPPPPYSPATITEPPSPTFLAQRSEHDMNELIGRPLDNEELYWFRTGFHGYSPGARFSEESRHERQRIGEEWGKRDEHNRPVYRGPDLIGRPGTQRLKIMTRNSIRKRWERLGVWNPDWEIPGRVNTGAYDNINDWRWEWVKPRQVQVTFEPKPHEEEMSKWPRRDEEGANARVIRQLLESKGQWSGRYGPALAESNQDTEIDVDPHESLITSRPWYRWKLEVEEEARRLARARRFTLPDYETATENAKARWKSRGDWKDTWCDTPGWKWRQESHSPEPADPNDMDFSPSELDALDSIPPRTPPPTFSPRLAPLKKGPRLFFTGLESHVSAAVQRAEDVERNVESEVDRIAGCYDLNGDAQTKSPDTAPFATPTEGQPEAVSAVRQGQSQEQMQTQTIRPSSGLPTTTRLRKRKRNREDEVCDNNERSSTEPTSLAAPRQSKRSSTATATLEARPQSNLNPGYNGKSTRKLASVEPDGRNPEQHASDSVGAFQAAEASPGRRRSARIRARRGTSRSTEYDGQIEPDSRTPGKAQKKSSKPQGITKARSGQQSLRTSQRLKRLKRLKGGCRAKARSKVEPRIPLC